MLLRLLFLFIPTFALWMADGSNGGGGGEGNSGGDKADPPADPAGSFQNLISRYKDDLGAVARQLFDENYQHRTRIRELETEIGQLENRLPGEDAVILSGDDVTTWQTYRELGQPDEIRTTLTEYQQLKRNGLLRSAADAHGYKASVLAQLAGELPIELGEVEADGQKKTIAYVVEGESRTPLDQYANDKWSDFMPSLRPDQSQGGGSGTNGTTYVQQQSGGKAAGSKDKVTEFIQRQKQAAKLDKPII